MSAFLRRTDGSLRVGFRGGTAFRSVDGGEQFDAWPTGLHLRALAERDGHLYAASDDFFDGQAVGVSDDDGAHWKPLLRFKDMCGPFDCVVDACKETWWGLVPELSIVPSAACGATLSPPDMHATHLVLTTPAGCACRAGGTSAPAPSLLIGAMLLASLDARCARRRQNAAPTPPIAATPVATNPVESMNTV
jgi:hypothetical protein